MTPEPPASENPESPDPVASAPLPSEPVAVGVGNPKPMRPETAKLISDYEAIKNDLLQAQELANDFQRQFADKCNETAHFKQLLTKTQEDLVRFERDITALRSERHKLANEVMQIPLLQKKIEQLTADLNATRGAQISAATEHRRKCQEYEQEIGRLRGQIDVLQRHLAPKLTPGPASSRPAPVEKLPPPPDDTIDIQFGR